MNINIIYEVNNREYNNCVLLQRELIRRGHTVKIYNKTEDVIYKNQDAITIIPNSYRNEDVEYYRYVFNTKNNPIIVYPCEQVTNHKLPLYFDFSSDNIVKRLPHLCWGNDYYNFISSLGYDMSINSVVGALQLDFCRKEFRSLYADKKVLSTKYNLPIDKKWILFISDFVYSTKTIVKQIESEGQTSTEVLEAKFQLENETINILIDWFAKFLKDHQDFIVIYRKHPVELLAEKVIEFRNEFPDQFYTISDLNIKDWIFNCDRISCWYSTAAVECLFAEKNIALLRPLEITKESGMIEYPFFRNYPQICDYNQFKDAMLNGGPLFTEEFINTVNELYAFDKKMSYHKVADAIEELACIIDRRSLEKNYYYKRFKYLLRRGTIIKSILKKIYQFMYIKFGLNLAKDGKVNYSVMEWNQTVENKKRYKNYARQIDQIIRENTGRTNNV